VVLSKTLEQPWSLAFLSTPTLVTERLADPISQNGVLDPRRSPRPGARAAGLQG
jgi:hypothetical protein